MANTTISLSTYYLKKTDIIKTLTNDDTVPATSKAVKTEMDKKLNKTDLITELNNIITEMNNL